MNEEETEKAICRGLGGEWTKEDKCVPKVEVFKAESCEPCKKVDEIIRELKQEFGTDLIVEEIMTSNIKDYRVDSVIGVPTVRVGTTEYLGVQEGLKNKIKNDIQKTRKSINDLLK